MSASAESLALPSSAEELQKLDITGFGRDKLASVLAERFGLPSFRARQLLQWIHRHGVRDFTLMTDISLALREAFAREFVISRPEPLEVQRSKDGTRKFLFKLADGAQVESVLIKQPTRNTLCISSQVGCAMGCTFCRTALMGLKRNLTSAEILGQVLAVQDVLREEAGEGGEIAPEDNFTNIVFMGMGEPLHNLPNVLSALSVLNDDLAHGMSQRKITVSTSGLVPAMKKFFAADAKANLAVSLNATTNKVRSEIMPINKRFPLEELIGLLENAPLNGNKRVTLEYVMLGGLNDTPRDLGRLATLIKNIPAKLNLIPYNENAGLGFSAPPRGRILEWQRALLDKGFNATIRWSKGDDISAACGQLATNSKGKRSTLNG